MKKIEFIVSILICQLAGILGSVFTMSEITNWYSILEKPLWTPASWVFGPVWITLYTLMGVALYLVWQKRNVSNVKKAILVFSFQLVLNALWSIIFFGLHNVFWALVEIIILLGSIIWTMFEFNKIDKRAMYLLLPYLLWVCVATALNYNIWILN
ncbi:tryptophan-rich sensory protein [Patescibacteria group bacterium]|nr:tryptophan-rich sensory protein [Patescibacteria group bacterium]